MYIKKIGDKCVDEITQNAKVIKPLLSSLHMLRRGTFFNTLIPFFMIEKSLDHCNIKLLMNKDTDFKIQKVKPHEVTYNDLKRVNKFIKKFAALDRVFHFYSLKSKWIAQESRDFSTHSLENQKILNDTHRLGKALLKMCVTDLFDNENKFTDDAKKLTKQSKKLVNKYYLEHLNIWSNFCHFEIDMLKKVQSI